MLLHEITFTPHNHRPGIRPEDGVIEGVRILGRESKNGRTYSDKAIREAAELYQGCEVNIDHPDDKTRSSAVMERGLAEGFGELRNISIRDDGVYGDLHYLKSHPMAPQVVERAQRFPSKVGLSHNAEGEVCTRAGRTVVEGIRRVLSVDVVSRPATNQSLFESETASMTKTTVRHIVERLFPRRAGRLLQEMDDAAADEPLDIPTEATADEEIKAAFRAMVMAVFDDDRLDAKATLQKIRDILRSQEKLLGGPDPNTDTASGSADPSELEEEVVELQQQLKVKEAELECRALLESLDVPADKTRLAALAAVPQELRPELARSWQPTSSRRAARPHVSAPLYEELGVGAQASVPDWNDTDSFITSITR